MDSYSAGLVAEAIRSEDRLIRSEVVYAAGNDAWPKPERKRRLSYGIARQRCCCPAFGSGEDWNYEAGTGTLG